MKMRLRRRALAWIGAKDARVFEGFAGSGAMWRAVWRGAGEAVGCDQRPIYDPARALYVGDCRRVMRAVDMGRFNVVDLDAFGSPWPAAYILSARRTLKPGERFVLVTTDGGRLNSKLGRLETTMAALANVKPDASGSHMNFGQITKSAVETIALRMGGVVNWSQVEVGFGHGGCIAYSAFGIVGLEPQDAEASAA